MSGLRMTLKTRLILKILWDGRDGWLYGYEIVRKLRMPPGAVYSVLHRLENHDWVEVRWETPPGNARVGRPLRRYVKLLPTRHADARKAIENADQWSALLRTEP